MTDLSSPLLGLSIIGTVVVGLAPHFIEPRRDRLQRRALVDREDKLRMENHLERLFAEIYISKSTITKLSENCKKRFENSKDDMDISPDLFDNLDKIYSIISTYFPRLLPIMQSGQ